jgi:hypothetical protein
MDCHIRVGNKLPTLPCWLGCAVQRSQAGKLCRHARDFVTDRLVPARYGQHQTATALRLKSSVSGSSKRPEAL